MATIASGTEKKVKARLVMKEVDFDRLRAHLLQADMKERAAFALLGKAELPDFVELYIHRFILPDDESYCEQSPVAVEPKAEFVLDTLASFAASPVSGFLHLHSHPFCSQASFSSIDDHYFPGMAESLKHYLIVTGNQKNFLFAALVWGQSESGFTARCLGPDGSSFAPVSEIKVVGKHGIRAIYRFQDAAGQQESQPLSGRFQRQVEFLGESGQRLIQKTHLAVCGVGGLGSFVVACARGLGFQEITLVDHDVLEESNLNRFQGATVADVGKPKVEVVAEATKRFDPHIKVNPVPARVEAPAAHEALLHADFIINCLDDDGARLEVQILAASHLKPLLDLGAGIILEEGARTVREMGGQAVLYFPGGPCLLCQGLDPTAIVSAEIREVQRAAGYIQGTDQTPPSVVTLNAVTAGIGLQLAINYLTGFAEVPTLLHYDLLRHDSTSLNFTKRHDCPICGDAGIEGRGDEIVRLPLGKSGTMSLPPSDFAPRPEAESPSPVVKHRNADLSVLAAFRRLLRTQTIRIKGWFGKELHAPSQG